jgi:hypothetical protein
MGHTMGHTMGLFGFPAKANTVSAEKPRACTALDRPASAIRPLTL